jgi:hypothetical protein
MRKVLTVVLLALLVPAAAHAQRTGVIAGVVVGEDGKPLADVEIAASAENAKTRTDSLGRFSLNSLEAGTYTVRARRLGYFPARVSADIGKGGRADIRIELKPRPAFLDSVVVTATTNCAPMSFTGFVCRKHGGKGVYLTDDDIFDKNAREIGDIFRGLPGFRIENRPTPFGTLPFPIATRASACLNALVNGRVASPSNPIPRFADEMIAVEIYASPSDIPEEYSRFAWGRTGRQTQAFHSSGGAERCALVVYWTRYT